MRKRTLTQSEVPGRVIGWTNFSHCFTLNSTWILLKFLMFYWSHLLVILLVLMVVELLFCPAVT